MLKYLVPNIALKDLPVMFRITLLGSVIAGSYGVIHDNITYLIAPEYFTHFKFEQFQWANLQIGDQFFVSCIGFLATWWVGLIVGWVLARRMLPNQSRHVIYQKTLKGFGVIFGSGLLFGVIGYIYGLARGPDADYSTWAVKLDYLGVSDHWAFIRVGYIHNAGYVGGFIGLVLTYFLVKPENTKSGTEQVLHLSLDQH